MQNVRNVFIIIFLLIASCCLAQNAPDILNYINNYKYLAIQEMKRSGIPASITLAQGIHESGAGKSLLAINSQNHFGIKCKTNWIGESVSHDDEERGECFRKYKSVEESFKDHSDFLKQSNRYATLFSLNPEDYRGWAYGLKKLGYATNPKYPELLIKLIEDYQLQQYTMLALNNKADNNSLHIVAEDHNKVIKPKIEYPAGVFKINETKVIYALKGTSFLSIAELYHVDLYRIFEFNEMPQLEEVPQDQLVYLQRKRKTGNSVFHIVEPLETLHDIAQQEAIRLESLLELNMLNADMQPAVGEQLFLRSKAAVTPKFISNKNNLNNNTVNNSASYLPNN